MSLFKQAATVAAAAAGLSCFSASANETPPDTVIFTGTASVPDGLEFLVARLDHWIDAHSDLPSARGLASIRLAGPAQFPPEPGDAPKIGQHVRGLYTPETATITLFTPWAPDNILDVSVLLHELVHHRQVWSDRSVCRAARERDAYRLQRAWLETQGAKLNVNWFAVYVGAGCTLRNVHPD